MKRGLVIGKFLPVHNGHIALINFAAQHCDELIVSLSYTTKDSIDPELRLQWLIEIFSGNKKIVIQSLEDNFDNENLPLPDRTKIWAEVVEKKYGKIDVLTSSEEYGEPFANHLNAKHILFDRDRKGIPVSGTLIRESPHVYWEFIPPIARPYFVKKICFYGPESTGKSFMAKKMAEKFNTEFVPEVARELITSNDFTVDDIIRIGKAQTERVQQKLATANKYLFCDSDLITTQIYSKHYLNEVAEILFELEKQITYDHYFLFDIDVPWVNDGLRDLGSDQQRKEMFNWFKTELKKREISYTLVRGNWEERERIILEYLGFKIY